MDKHDIIPLIKDLSQRMGVSVRPGLAEEIKRHIPEKLVVHRMDTINITVDLRISRVAAAAAILIALMLIGAVVRYPAAARQMLHDSRLLVKYSLVGDDAYRGETLSDLMGLRDSLIAQGREVVYYGDRVNPKDAMAVLMQWKIGEDKYGLIMGDLSAQTVNATDLIRLQAHMLQDRYR